MKTYAKMFTAISLALCAVAYAPAWSDPDVPNQDKLALAKSAEQKADLARLHNDYSSAVYYYQKASRTDDHNSALFNKLAISEFKLGNKGEARKHFTQAVKLDPRNVAALNNLGAVALVDRKFNSAVRYLKQALQVDELNATAHLNLAEAWMGLEQVDRAMTEYARALELDADILTAGQSGVVAQVTTPEQRARVSYLIAKAYAKRGNLEGALEYLRRAKDGRYPELANVYTDQEFAALWPDPRLAKIIKR
jgi:tetratricopeptide (TPR) repeat protein